MVKLREITKDNLEDVLTYRLQKNSKHLCPQRLIH